MSEQQSFERTKLKKQLTQRKRGKEPTVSADTPAEEVKSTASTKKSSYGSPNGFVGKQWKKHAPTYMQSRPTSKMAFDVCFFAASALFVIKMGKTMNDILSNQIPTEASMR